MEKNMRWFSFVGIGLSFLSFPALAHSLDLSGSGFYGGLIHPLVGLDHLLAFFALGLWASQNKQSTQIIFPLVLAVFMLGGSWIGMAELSHSFVEVGIAFSVIFLGLVLWIQPQINDLLVGAIVASFAFVHGHAHGTELMHPSLWGQYALGFTVMSLVIYGTALLLGRALNRGSFKEAILQSGGMTIAAIGSFFLLRIVH